MKKNLILMLGAMALSGCVHPGQMTGSQPDASQLANRMFVLSSVDGEAVVAHRGIKPGISFDKGLKVSGVMCNRFFGQGILEQGRLSVPRLASTQMMCSDARLNQWEQTLSLVLSEGASVKLAPRTLTLSGSGHTLVYLQQDSQD